MKLKNEHVEERDHGGKRIRVTVVEREPEPHEIEAHERASLRAALAELQAELARLRPGWTPKHPVK